MEPTKKAPSLTDLLETVYGRTTAIEGNNCIPPPIGCGLPITGFDNDLSLKEYRISGLCQSCQNEVFGKD